MLGNLTIDKASMNISCFLYSVKIIQENAGRITRKEFVKTMAEFIGLPYQKNGKENRTPYNKSKLPRYFGFVDLAKDADGSSILVLTQRGAKLADIISERPNYHGSEDQYYIKAEDQSVFTNMFLESVLFDTFGKNNCGAETSNTDVEPPKVVFKTLALLGRATAAEIVYIMYSLNRGMYSSYDDALNAVKEKRAVDQYDYSTILEEWGLTNIANDCKIINIFTDDSIKLILSERDEEIGKTFYKLNPHTTQHYQKEIEQLSPVYAPLQMTIHSSDINTALQWINETILGRVSNTNCITIFERSVDATSTAFIYEVLVPVVARAYNNEKINHYLIIKNADTEQLAELFGTLAPLLVRETDFTSVENGFSSKAITDEEVYSNIVAISGFAKALLKRSEVLLPPNFHIVSIESETVNMSREYDYTFTQCLINSDANVNSGNPSDTAGIFEGFQPWLTTYNNPDYTGKEKYTGYPKALVKLVGFMQEQGLIDDTNLDEVNLDKYQHFLTIYDASETVKDFDETKLSSKAGGAALKKYIKYIEYLLSPHAEAFDYIVTAGNGENTIFFGTPGCGKSYHVEHNILGKDKDTGKYTGNYEKDHIIRTTFYQDYSNTDFVGQILPKVFKGKNGAPDTVEYIFNPGPFTLALIQAISNPTKKVALVVEEINRGNAPAIFGDIFQLLDRDANAISEYGIKNVSLMDYLNDYEFIVDGQKKKYIFTEIKIPGNMDIFATMNTSDQNVYTLDTAFVRRWEKEKIKNTFAKCTFRDKNVPGMDCTWQKFVEDINTCITSHLEDLQVNEDKQIGAFFVKEALLSGSTEKFAYKVFDYLWNDVAKLDHEIFFNHYDTLDALIAAYIETGVAVFKPGVFK